MISKGLIKRKILWDAETRAARWFASLSQPNDFNWISESHATGLFELRACGPREVISVPKLSLTLIGRGVALTDPRI